VEYIFVLTAVIASAVPALKVREMGGAAAKSFGIAASVGKHTSSG
jgi:hypothetical protein